MINYLFLAVSTDFTITEPLVPGNFTYSSFGAGAWDEAGVAACFFASASVSLGVEGRSSDLRELKAFVMIRGMNLGRDGGDDAGSGGNGGGAGTLESDASTTPAEATIDGGTLVAGRTTVDEGEP